MREITSHRMLPSINDLVRIEVGDEPNKAGVHCKYNLLLHHSGQWQKVGNVKFQEGNIKEEGSSINGVTNETLIAVVLDRLQCYQTGSISCRENAVAITKLQEALFWLNHRTHDRTQRNVEGLMQK